MLYCTIQHPRSLVFVVEWISWDVRRRILFTLMVLRPEGQSFTASEPFTACAFWAPASPLISPRNSHHRCCVRLYPLDIAQFDRRTLAFLLTTTTSIWALEHCYHLLQTITRPPLLSFLLRRIPYEIAHHGLWRKNPVAHEARREWVASYPC